MTDLNQFISKWLHPSAQGEVFVVPENIEGVEWEHDPHDPAIFETETGPQFPRVVPPERATARPREAMAHDGGPGVKDHSLLKRLLREWL
jgi:hypothetical protein